MSKTEEIAEALPDRPLTPEEVERLTARIGARAVSTLTHEDPETGEDRVGLFALLTRSDRIALWIDHGPDGWDVEPLAIDVSERAFYRAIRTAQEDVLGEDVGDLSETTKRIRGKGRHAELEDLDVDLYGGDRDE